MANKHDDDLKLLPRDAEFVLGLAGGILGLIGSLSYIYFTFYLEDEWVYLYFLPGLTRVAASVVGIWMAYKVQYESKKAGIIMVVCAVWLFLLANATRPGAIIMVIAGFMCLYRK